MFVIGDAHIHLDALSAESACRILDSRADVFSVSCDPEGYERFRGMIATEAPALGDDSDFECLAANDYDRVDDADSCAAHGGQGIIRAGLGLHPWCVPTSDAPLEERRAFERQLGRFEELTPTERFVGEIGLDFWGGHSQTHDEQLAVFNRVCAALESRDHVISLHTRGADREALDCLEEHGVVPDNGHVLVLHGFNGPSDQLTRALRLGCMFSLGERELKTKRGHEYARQLPIERLLLETDMPRGQIVSLERASTCCELNDVEWQSSLSRACDLLASIKKLKPEEVAHTLNATLRSLLLRRS